MRLLSCVSVNVDGKEKTTLKDGRMGRMAWEGIPIKTESEVDWKVFGAYAFLVYKGK